MDRKKPGKSSKPHFLGSGELIALGKNTRPGGSTSSGAGEGSASERKGSVSAGSSGSGSKSLGSSLKSSGGTSSSSSGSKSVPSLSSSSERKREAGSSSSPHDHPTKKSRIHGSSSGTPSSSSSGSSSKSGSSSASFSSSSLKAAKPIKRESIDSLNVKQEDLQKDTFFSELEKAEKHSNNERGQNLILAAIKKLRANREKPDLRLCEMLMMASKEYPHFLTGSTSITDALTSLATSKKSSVPDAKLKFSQHNLSIFAPMAVHILANAYNKSSAWPNVFVQLWMDDACGDRFWVDSPHSKSIVDNLVNSFGTIPPNPSLLPPSDGGPGSLPSGSSSPSLTLSDDSSIQGEANQIIIDQKADLSLLNRFPGKETALETIITDYATELHTKKAPDIPRNMVKALGQASGLTGVRAFILTKLEQWLHNQKCGRQAQEVLLTVCVNANANTPADLEVVNQITKLRMKTKPLVLFHSMSIREMVRDNDTCLRHVLNQIIFNELSPQQQRNPNNLPILGTIISGLPDSRTVLAEIFLDLLTRREDFHHALRLLLREILRNCRQDCDLSNFLKGLLKKNSKVTWPTEFRERGFLAIADLILLSMFLSVSPQVREASMVRGDSKDQTTLLNFRKQISAMQNDAVLWLYQEVPSTFFPAKGPFLIALNKIILKDPANDLFSKDGWPPEQEKALFARLVLDVPAAENVIVWLSLMGLHKDYPMLPRECFDLIELLVVRAATHRTPLKFQKPELYELLFRLSEYKHPDEIVLPEGYEPPKLTISKLYWQSWLILCILAAHNPLGVGKLGWEEYPMLRVLMEMCMTNHFQFPTASTEASVEDVMSREIQTTANEKQEILEFETHLAAASSKQTINERNSLLLSQLMRLDPFGAPRNPPSQFLGQLQHLNVELNLGQLLCRSRNPDFLLDLIQNNSQPMPWLSQLVSEGSFDMLPIQCLCEFFLGNSHKIIKGVKGDGVKTEDGAPEKSPRKHGKSSASTSEDNPKDGKTLQLLFHLHEVIHRAEDFTEAREVIEYFLRRLSSPKVQNRQQAAQGLQLLFASPPFTQPVDSWLLDCLPTLNIFGDIKDQVVLLLRQALQIETEPNLIYKYVEFINVWGGMSDTDGGAALVMDVASLVGERSILMSFLLGKDPNAFEPFFNIFLGYMKFVRQPPKNEYRWSQSEQDLLLVRWVQEQLEAIMNLQIIQATAVLIITYSQVCSKSGKDPMIKTPLDIKFNELMDIWFPHSKDNTPKGFLLNTTEEAVLFPTWITLKMAKTDNARLLQAALRDLSTENFLDFFQSLGFPTKSTSTILYCLDAQVEQNPESVKVHIKNPAYLKTLVEVYWKKGITTGKTFYKLVQVMANAETAAQKLSRGEVGSSPSSKKSQPHHMLRPTLVIPSIKEPSSRNQLKLKDNKQGAKSKSLLTPPRKGQASSNDKDKTVASYESEVCDEETSRMKIATLSKQLYTLSSPPSSKRRSSVPLDPYGGLEDSMGAALRRHSSYYDPSCQNHGMMDSVVPTYANNLGELVDNITYVEPCIVRHAMDYQLPLLFGRNEIHPNCRSFLMTVLTHQAGWETVENLITLFLKEFDSTHDPAAVLDLIAATSSNPKLWQGVDKYIPRHQANISPFQMSGDQLVTMAEYIVEEISQVEMKSTKFSISNLLGPTQPNLGKGNGKMIRNGLQERVKLWLQCCHQDKDIVDHVISTLMDKKGKNPCAKKMVAQVYLEFPEIIFVEKWTAKAEELNFTEEEITCVLDNVSHTLITGIANTQPGKDWAKKASHEMEICLRKLTSVHPTLFLRQVPLMGTLLEGRAHLEFSAFHQQNHHIPFVVFLGLLDLMQPHVLKHFQSLKGAFALYFKLFQDYGHLKDYSSSLSRFSVLLHNFLSANPKEVKEFLSPYYNTLRELSTVKYYVDVYPLQNLLSFLVPPNLVSDLCAATPAQVKNLGTDANTASFVSSMTNRFLHVSNSDELVPILQELDLFSSRNPAVLHHFSEHLSPLLASESDCCRNQALSLILKHVTYKPGSCKHYLESMMQALESRNSHVRDSVLERIHEFIVLCQESGEDILMKIFDLGVNSNINVGASLKKSLSLLRNYSSTNQF